MLQDDDPRLDLHFLAVRQGVGLLGLILPTLLYLYGRSAPGRMQPSISEFYYTAMGDIFVGALAAIGVFLISYKGYRKRPERFWFGDTFTSLTAGIAALGVAFFPAGSDPEFALCVTLQGTQAVCTIPPETTFLTGLHYINGPLHFTFAAIFFAALAYFCLVLFPMGVPLDAQGRRPLTAEHLAYILCGVTLIVSMFAVAVYALLPTDAKATLRAQNYVFWAEAAGVYAFAIAWLVKGKALTRPLGMRMGRV